MFLSFSCLPFLALFSIQVFNHLDPTSSGVFTATDLRTFLQSYGYRVSAEQAVAIVARIKGQKRQSASRHHHHHLGVNYHEFFHYISLPGAVEAHQQDSHPPQLPHSFSGEWANTRSQRLLAVLLMTEIKVS